MIPINFKDEQIIDGVRLKQRIGEERLNKLDQAAALGRYKKYSRLELEWIINNYSLIKRK